MEPFQSNYQLDFRPPIDQRRHKPKIEPNEVRDLAPKDQSGIDSDKQKLNPKIRFEKVIMNNKESKFNPSEYFEEVMDVIRAGTGEVEGDERVCVPHLPTASPHDEHACSCGLPPDDKEYGPCTCAEDREVPTIAWKPAPISKIQRPPKEPKKKKTKEESAGQKKKEAEKQQKLQSEYDGSIGKTGRIIIKKKLLVPGQNTED
ncbi:hypothetical protein AAG570_005579 [Ranatra chinensis]|uniref:Uncharacterized protein n=1 Tax=Ranatra chinensis TaxID=642074 RepID=A0ABD0YJL2_9HEMI